MRFVPTLSVAGSLQISARSALRRSRNLVTAVVFSAAIAGLGADHSAKAAAKDAEIIIDMNSGAVLHERKADAARFPASLTKVMTIYVVFEMIESGRLSLDTELVMTASAAKEPPSKLHMKPGQRITVRDAIRALTTKSANDVAAALAENIAGSVPKFARYMTWKARQLGMTSTTFRNASGLPNSAQKTTARDMAILGQRIFDAFPQHYHFFSTKTFKYGKKRYRNHNRLLFNFRGTDGIKTGYIRASGFNLLASVRRDGKHVMGVVMGGKSGKARNARMTKLLKSALKRASTRKTRKPGVPVPEPLLVATNRDSGSQATTTQLRVSRANKAASPPAKPTSDGFPGPYHVQVGAYGSATEAERRLSKIRGAHSDLVSAHKAFTMRFARNGKTYYRARFAGFSLQRAKSTCSRLKQQGVDCAPMLSN